MDVFRPRWYDTLTGELAILSTDRRNVSVSLKATTQRRLGKALKKEIDHRTWMSPELNDEQLGYAADDVVQLFQLKDNQRARSMEVELNGDYPLRRSLDLETRLIPTVLRMVINGLPISMKNLFEYLEKQVQLVQSVESDLKEALGPINLGSPVQVKKAFAALGRPMLSTNADALTDLTMAGGQVGKVAEMLLVHRHATQRLKMYTSDWVDQYVYDGFTHGRLWCLGTDTGRFSSSNPNLQQIPVDMRWVFEAPDGYGIVSADYCLDPTTEVETPIGRRQMQQIRTGDWVYTSRENKIDVGQVTASTPIKPLEAYHLTFDNGETVVASADHRWPIRQTGTRDLVELRTDALKVGMRFIPFHRTDARYPVLYSYSHYDYVYEHDLVARASLGPKPPKHEVHHIDGNSRNNDPSNLKYVSKSDHVSYERKKSYTTQDHEYRREKLREGIKRRRSYVGEGNPRFGHTLSDETKQRISMAQKARFAKKRGGQRDENHVLVSIEPIGSQPMWAITVDPDHNYVLAAGVVTLNSQIEVRVAAAFAQDPVLLAALEDEDVHRQIAAEVFGVAFEDVTKEQRSLSKAMSFTLIFGGGGKMFYEYARLQGAEITQSGAFDVIDAFFTRFSGLRAFIDRARAIARARSVVVLTLPTGLRRILAGQQLTSTRILNTRVQGSAAAGLKFGLLETQKRGIDKYLGATVHDELVGVVPWNEMDEYGRELEDCMIVGMHKVISTTVKVGIKKGKQWS
jgi:DNA polymerase I-like protein with 3'-5' exonuclease and polymerase domains